VEQKNYLTPLLLKCNFEYLFENRVLRRVFGPKRDEVTGEMEKIT
jgi:hypothetical protein